MSTQLLVLLVVAYCIAHGRQNVERHATMYNRERARQLHQQEYGTVMPFFDPETMRDKIDPAEIWTRNVRTDKIHK